MVERLNRIILNTSDEAAQYKSGISGWVDRHGRFWGDDEHMARWSGCTYSPCVDCDNPVPKPLRRCKACSDKCTAALYRQMARVPYSPEVPLYSMAAGIFFFDLPALIDHLTDALYLGESPENVLPALQLVHCQPVYLRQIDEDFFADDLGEDGDIPDNVRQAVAAFNASVKAHGPVSWQPSRNAVDLETLHIAL